MKKYMVLLGAVIFALLGTALAGEPGLTAELFVAPAWLWPVIVTGAVQGLVTYGAIKVKFDWLFTSLSDLQQKQDGDHKALSSRLDNLIFRHARRIGDGPEEH